MPNKVCSQCQRKNGVRTRICACGFKFEIKEKSKLSTKEVFIEKEQEDAKNSSTSIMPIYGYVYAPAGDCPIKPKGLKQWQDGIAPEDCITEWALALKEYGKGRFAPEAIVYWARYFWDIHSLEFKRVSSIIFNTLVQKKQIVEDLNESDDLEDDQDFAEI